MDEKRALLRHTLATLAYRAARALENAPDRFAVFDGAGRQPEQILAHMGDLFDWALSMAEGQQRGTIPNRWPGPKSSGVFLPRSGSLTRSWRRLSRCKLPWSGFFRGR